MPRRLPLLVLAVFAMAGPLSTQALDPQGVELFEQKIRPVLVQHCYECHSEQAAKDKKLKAQLFLDSRAGVLKGGESGPAIVPGKSQDSLLIKALRYDDYEMPPAGQLPTAVLADFVKWVDLGAPDPRDGPAGQVNKREIDLVAGRQFWSFKPLEPAPPPEVKNSSWVRTPLDRFVLARLEEKGLLPGAVASKEKLLRRACFDLVGLPPAPEEVTAFLQDQAPDAYERLVDRLLASPHYGERWARHWLDVVRYAESGGYEFDGDRPGAYHYRDFVIKSFNDDLPYNEFVRLQIAGDKLRPTDYAAGCATGFLVAGPYPGQITSKTVERIRYDQLDDMLSTLGGSMLGLTLGCVRCHDHKYDPIPQQDYYKMIAALGRVVSAEQKLDPQPEVYRAAKSAWDQAHAPLVETLAKFRKDEFPARMAAWLETVPAKQPNSKWQLLDFVRLSGKATLTQQDDRAVVAAGKIEANETYTLVAHTHQRAITALRLEALAYAQAPLGGSGLSPEGNLLLTKIEITATPLSSANKAPPQKVKLKPAGATFEQEGHGLAGATDDDGKTGWSVGGRIGQDHSAVFELEGDVGFEGGTVLSCVLKFENNSFGIARTRLAITTAPRPAGLEGNAAPQALAEIRALLAQEQGQLTEKNSSPALAFYRRFDMKSHELLRAVEEHAAVEPKANLVSVFTIGEGGGDVFLLTRGDVDRKQQKATPGFLQALTTASVGEDHWLPTDAPGKTPVEPRVALANWLVDADAGAGRVLARVMVNRLWKHHFNKGLVATPNDFGAQGERPTHRELLDWLSTELIHNGWKLKPLHKLIMTSSVYMQGNEVSAENLQVDPENRLLWHRSPKRLEGELIRDALLTVSGVLDRNLYGPGTLDENSPRRSIYLTVKRSSLVPFLQMFDLPEPIQSIGERSSTTVPTQALALLNSPLVRQRSERLAARVRAAAGSSPQAAVDTAYVIALSRKPTSAEQERMLGFLARQEQLLGENPQTADKALAELCHLLLCLNEFVYVD